MIYVIPNEVKRRGCDAKWPYMPPVYKPYLTHKKESLPKETLFCPKGSEVLPG